MVKEHDVVRRVVAAAISRLGCPYIYVKEQARFRGGIFMGGNCFVLTNWLFTSVGWWTRDRCIEEQERVGIDVAFHDAGSACLVFGKGRRGYQHVGMVAKKQGRIYVVHASYHKKGVVAEPMHEFDAFHPIQMFRRIIT